MKRPRILVVGSFVMDQIASTVVFPREGQTVLGRSFHKAPGGKGANQAVQASRRGQGQADCASGCAVIILEETPGKATKNRIIVISGSNMTISVSYQRSSNI